MLVAVTVLDLVLARRLGVRVVAREALHWETVRAAWPGAAPFVLAQNRTGKPNFASKAL